MPSSAGELESGEVLEALAEALYLEREYSLSAAHYERRGSLLGEAIAIGRLFVMTDRVEEGLVLSDEALAAV